MPREDPYQLRRLDLSDIIDWRSVVLWALPLWVFIATLALIQDFAGDTIANARPDISNMKFRSRDDIHIPYVYSVYVALFSTLFYAIWSQFLRLRGVRHAELYAVAAWVLCRVLWWLPVPIFDHVMMKVYADRLPMFGGEWGIVVVTLLAAAGAITAIRAAYRGESPARVWWRLALAAPFAAMFMILVNISDASRWAVTIVATEVSAASFFALASVIGSIMMRRKASRADAPRRSPLLKRLKRFAVLFAVFGAFVSLAVVIDTLWELIGAEFSSWGVIVNWTIIALATGGVYLFVRRIYGVEYATRWGAATCLISTAVVLLPAYFGKPIGFIVDAPVTRLDQISTPFVDEAGRELWYIHVVKGRMGAEILFPCGITLMLLLLVASLEIRFMRSALPFMAASALPALFFFTLVKPPLITPPQGIDLVYWAEPAIVLIVVWAIIFVVLGYHTSEDQQVACAKTTSDT